ncbi:MAG: hypothetical protein KF716_26605 [Anaerolineae bacterium]|nr:hypothetical protein [Anaerolineae bacterium]
MMRKFGFSRRTALHFYFPNKFSTGRERRSGRRAWGIPAVSPNAHGAT